MIPDIDADDVLDAVAEFDRLGRAEFLSNYGYGQARTYFLVHEGRRYDSKAIVGVAHRLRHGDQTGPANFSGGEATVGALLRGLGFTVKSARNPAWTWEEVVLACDLFRDNGWRRLEETDRRAVELSALLRHRPFHQPEDHGSNYRSPSSVARKTVDIGTRHPDYEGIPTNGGSHDTDVLRDFLADTVRMAATAAAIRSAMQSPIDAIDVPELDLDDVAAEEGRLLERRHLARERSPRLRRRKIDAVRAETGSVACEACGFDFGRTYGDHGADFIECHHRIPLHVSGSTTTALKDLVLLCSNCHRMIHRTRPWLTVEHLMELITRP